jgi:uncharacterized protein (TIGR00255 family)
LRVEIRTVNHRFLCPSLKLPADLAPLEGQVRDRVRREFRRGHVTVSAHWLEGGAVSGGLRLNVAAAREAMARLRELQTAVGLSGEIPLELLAHQANVLMPADEKSAAPPWSEVERVVADAAADCRAMRRREGERLAADLRQVLAELEELGRAVEERAPERLVAERNRLRARVEELLDGRPVDEQRLVQELAFLAERLDISEELVRFRTHLAAALAALAREGPVGKELGFLAQELGREINTLGAKANDAVIVQRVIAMKGALERFREQAENLE